MTTGGFAQGLVVMSAFEDGGEGRRGGGYIQLK